MITWDAYKDAAQAYAVGVRALLAPGPEAAMRGVPSTADLATRAAALAPVSAKLTQVTSLLLVHDDPLARAQASGRLLAKSLIDLQVGVFLAGQADDEGGPWPTRGGGAPDAGLAAPEPAELEDGLSVLLADPPRPWPSAAVRSAPAAGGPVDPASRVQLARAVVETLVCVRDRAAQAGQAALGGLLGMGLAEVAQAAGVVGLDLARALGQGEAVARVLGQAQAFFLNAYNALVAALGPMLARTAANQVTAWVAELKTGVEFGTLLDRMYETGRTGAALGQLVAGSQAAPEQFVAANQALLVLQEQFGQQAGLIEKIARVLILAGSAPAAMLPHGRLLLASAYVALGGYVVLAGADFVDAPRMRLIDRVPGVRRVVEADLGPAPVLPAGPDAPPAMAAVPAPRPAAPPPVNAFDEVPGTSSAPAGPPRPAPDGPPPEQRHRG